MTSSVTIFLKRSGISVVY